VMLLPMTNTCGSCSSNVCPHDNVDPNPADVAYSEDHRRAQKGAPAVMHRDN
jgi:hypothetical protein